MMKSIIPVAVVALCSYMCSCNIINPAEKVPTFIYLDSVRVTSSELSRTGSTNSKVTSAWVYQDNNLVGVFGVPSNIPIPLDKAATVKILPGISLDGLKNFQDQYDFYTFDTFTVQPQPGVQIHHTSKVEYTSAARIQIVCDFETGNTFRKTNEDNTSDTTIIRTADKSKVFEGGGSGLITLDVNHPTSENINTPDNYYTIPTGKSYVEINYKSDVDFEVGLQGTQSGNIVYEYPVVIKATDTWNKMYIGLESLVGTFNSSAYRIMIKASLPDGQATGYVLVDNIKIVSY